MKIVIDPGHGGSDPGASGNGLLEKEVVLDLALRIREHLLAQYDVQVMMTRETDVYLSLADRCRLANDAGADYFHSVHCNASSSPAADGYEDYIHDGLSDTSRTGQIQNTVHAEIMSFLASYGVRDRGKKTAGFYVLRKTVMPAVLTENLFLTSKKDADILRQDQFRDKLAAAHARGIAMALGLRPKSGGTPIIGAPQATVQQAQAWARDRKAHDRFIAVLPLYWQEAQRYGIRPEVAASQAAKETAFGRFTGVVPPEYHNWCGLKTAAGGSDSDPSAHARFKDDETGVRAHLQHLAAYAGLPLPPGDVIVDPRYALVRRGSASTVEDLGGKWAPSPDYGRSIVRDYLSPMIAAAEADRAPVFSDVSPEHWAASAIHTVARRGIMRGYDDGTFRPDAPLTRAEAAAIIDKIIKR